MWLAGSKEQAAYLGTKSVGFTDARGAWQWRDSTSVEAGLALITEAARSAASGRRPRVRLWLSGALARPFIVEPVSGVRGRDEALRVAEGLAPDATGLAGPCAVWLDEGLLGRSVLGVAIDRSTLDQIENQFKGGLAVQLTSIRPWWTFSVDQALALNRAASTLLVEEPDALTLLSGEEGRFSLATTCWPLPDPSHVDGWVRRALLGANIAPGHALHALLESGDGPTAEESRSATAPPAVLRAWS